MLWSCLLKFMKRNVMLVGTVHINTSQGSINIANFTLQGSIHSQMKRLEWWAVNSRADCKVKVLLGHS